MRLECNQNSRADSRGTSFVELMIAMAVVGVAVMILIQQVTISLHERKEDNDAHFAHGKAVAMLAEIQAAVDQGTITSGDELDALAQDQVDPILTTRAVDAPDHVMSGNILLGSGAWKWLRQIDVQPIEGSDRSRYVRIRVKRRSEKGGVFTSAAAAGILNITIVAEPVVKEYDVYVLALATAPSLWQPLPALRAQMQSLADEIGGANPNLRFRLHWITELGYGRDASYVPYVNQTTGSDLDAPFVYWYPGKLAPGAGASTLYAAEMFGGQVRTEAGLLHGYDADDNPHPHAVADRFNHCLRTPAARALFEQRVAAGLADRDAPPLQLLLADMQAEPDRFRNALFVNLHGEGLPCPPLRNVSDAAKDPTDPGVRAVTHPARLHTVRAAGGGAGDALGRTEILAGQILSAMMSDDDADETGWYDDLKKAYNTALDARGKIAEAKLDAAVDKLDKTRTEISDGVSDGFPSGSADPLLKAIDELIADLSGGASGSTAVELRVYAYKTDPSAGDDALDAPITVQIMGVDLTRNVNQSWSAGAPATLEIRRLVGGVGGAAYEGFDSAAGKPPVWGPASGSQMAFTCGYVAGAEPYTWIRLYNTPLICPPVGGRGLHPDSRLYGMDYIPSPVVADRFYELDNLTGTMMPKNTARWRIRINGAELPDVDTRLEIRTRIGTDVTTGRAWPSAHQPDNLSTTWAWWTDSPDDVPATERYQFLGDPRHCPYLDLTAAGTSFAHGYNWWFDDMRAVRPNGSGGTMNVDWSNPWSFADKARLADGFGPGVVEDLPRLLQLWRNSLQSTGAVFCNPGGPIAGRLLLGGEIVLPAATGAAAPVILAGPFYGESGAVAVDDVSTDSLVFGAAPGGETLSHRVGRPVVVNDRTGFWAKPWLGELWSDADRAVVDTYGNVRVSGAYRRGVRAATPLADLPHASDWSFSSGSTPGDLGGASLLQTGGSGSSYVHVNGSSQEISTLSDEAYALTQLVGLSTPRQAPSALPFTLSGTPSMPLPQRGDPVAYPDQDATLLETFAVSSADRLGAAVVRVAAPASGRAAFFVPFGDTPQTADDHRALGYKSLALGLRALFVAGEPARTGAIDTVPILEIASPQPREKLRDPGSVTLTWSTQYRRFDRSPFTANYPDRFVGREMRLGYVVTYRAEGEEEWRYASDDRPATPGQRPLDPLRTIADMSTGDESFVMFLPSGDFPSGNYVVRIDCFSLDGDLHVAHHEVWLKIDRGN